MTLKPALLICILLFPESSSALAQSEGTFFNNDLPAVRGGHKGYFKVVFVDFDVPPDRAGMTFDIRSFRKGASTVNSPTNPRRFHSCGLPKASVVKGKLRLTATVRNEWTGHNLICHVSGRVDFK